ncbi:4-hydroxy-3-methylbut-2-enyl diphosphate reductase [Pontibacter sp. BT310]|uniref:4-hydroxy-3-methylbut-2-enyl diphosphate reductase n=1 Tax=Pontibacter populi TaxID=890055 RepID=A0ABS6XBV9_9BACT|nr:MULTISPECIES: 4-hydroxy-3-methylbut-2-enyl diphosphate reductase [Pontibacter]MBJ6118548.1 4-hydroxy-3-methylbut-2-enyl diphosphate reductase [Pontibacter sp. BT310]MBR0570977.1 4-hydroxy-3-methylbut-2-enyl diphosphate reductase [Microvirga sp. STS03]MBW3365402.1 4-hydroxy-3-methylbut-2-enyl diphosphate reductase [Pontibacter populi]
MQRLNVTIDSNSGFCFGVVYAIQMAEDILDEKGYLYCLGDIVHNDEEVQRLQHRGLRIIDHTQFRELQNEAVLIRAHGEPPETYQTALNNNLTLIDASCPVVLKLQNRIKSSYDKDDRIFIYGKHGHAEVLGLLGQTNNKAVVFENIDELLQHELPSKITLYSQTTKSTDNFYSIKDQLETKGYEVDANDTICRQVSNRDKELRKFAAQFTKIVFVSGTKSSNGKVLYQVCKNTNPDSYFISKAEELQQDWFKAGDTVGICGATSTPMWLMEQVRDSLLKLEV